MLELKLITLFKNYITAFENYDFTALQACYHLPCTLHTPDKIAYLANDKKFTAEFKDIFTVLRHAKTTKIIATKASYNQSVNSSIDVCIDWAFIDDSNEVFADFTAFFHVIKIAEQLKIVSVVSHDLTNSIELTSLLNISR